MALNHYISCALVLFLFSYHVASQAPTVTISTPAATIVGLPGAVEQFSGIPFAQPPVNALRLKPPQALTAPLGIVYANKKARQCPQFGKVASDNSTATLQGLNTTASEGEDCLTLDVYRPRGFATSARLPVLLWIYGGGFQTGSTASLNGSSLVVSSVNYGQPMLVVEVNYRLGGFGFLAGRELLAEGSTNLGLRDQRMGLQWVADNIASFGGDPGKVTIWGESAGSLSVFNQLILYGGNNTYKGKPLFRGAIMNSGTIVPTDPCDCPKAQRIYDTVVRNAGCSGRADTLACLRGLDYAQLHYAVNSVPVSSSYTSVALSYIPRADGSVMPESPDRLLVAGRIARVPVIAGAQEDEGTVLALPQFNITTKDQVVDYLMTFFFAHGSEDTIGGLVSLYDNILTYGSPFRTGFLNNWYPQFKRLAGILGDLTFTLTRRMSLEVMQSHGMKTWSYLSSFYHGFPIIGTAHATDVPKLFDPPNDFVSSTFQQHYVAFVNHLDPNQVGANASLLYWPQWGGDRQMLQIQTFSANLLRDDFRDDVVKYLWSHLPRFYF